MFHHEVKLRFTHGTKNWIKGIPCISYAHIWNPSFVWNNFVEFLQNKYAIKTCIESFHKNCSVTSTIQCVKKICTETRNVKIFVQEIKIKSNLLYSTLDSHLILQFSRQTIVQTFDHASLLLEQVTLAHQTQHSKNKQEANNQLSQNNHQGTWGKHGNFSGPATGVWLQLLRLVACSSNV